MLYAVEIPPYGGDTIFANQYEAYETLSDGLRKVLDGLTSVNTSTKAMPRRRARTPEERGRGDESPDRGAPVGPHAPRSGRRALYTSTSDTRRTSRAGRGGEPAAPRVSLQHQLKPDSPAASSGSPAPSRSGTTAAPSTTRERLRRLQAPHAPRDAGRRYPSLAEACMKLQGKTALIQPAPVATSPRDRAGVRREGADLVLTPRQSRELEAVAAECRKAGVRVVPSSATSRMPPPSRQW